MRKTITTRDCSASNVHRPAGRGCGGPKESQKKTMSFLTLGTEASELERPEKRKNKGVLAIVDAQLTSFELFHSYLVLAHE